jgi:hypothetical protein
MVSPTFAGDLHGIVRGAIIDDEDFDAINARNAAWQIVECRP